MDKEFKTVSQLVELLESRHVITDEETAAVLKRYSYYAIVNGYKDTFLDRVAMQATHLGDVYKKGTTFKQIYDLFLFDRDMRNAVFPYLGEAETIMKTAVVYAFCEQNRKVDAYLNPESYVTERNFLVPDYFKGDKKAEYQRSLDGLLREFNRKLKPSGEMRPFIKHYLDKHEVVPLWVLQNALTFGNIRYFYQLQKRGVQNKTCQIVSEVAGHNLRITEKQLLRAFVVLVGYRNICAHDDRFYCAEVKGAHVDKMIDMLNLVLPRERLTEMSCTLEKIADKYRGRIDAQALNSMYTNPEDVPKEFRRVE